MKWWVLILFGLYAGYYWLTHQQDASFTGRRQLVDLSLEQEAALGLQAYQQLLSGQPVLESGELPGQVREIMRRLVEAGPVAEEYAAQTAGIERTTQWDKFDWEVNVIDAPEVNAFCLPGGKMAVYTGLIPVAQNHDALAVVMGHEIAHALLRHGSERMAQQKLAQLGALAAGVSMTDMDPQQRMMVMAALGAGAQYGVLLPFSRSHESEADEVGLLLTAAACFDPREAIPLWQRMGEASANRPTPPEFASTHPAHATRIQRLEAALPRAMDLRERRGCPALPGG